MLSELAFILQPNKEIPLGFGVVWHSLNERFPCCTCEIAAVLAARHGWLVPTAVLTRPDPRGTRGGYRVVAAARAADDSTPAQLRLYLCEIQVWGWLRAY